MTQACLLSNDLVYFVAQTFHFFSVKGKVETLSQPGCSFEHIARWLTFCGAQPPFCNVSDKLPSQAQTDPSQLGVSVLYCANLNTLDDDKLYHQLYLLMYYHQFICNISPLSICSDLGLMLGMSALKLFMMANYVINSVDNNKLPCYTLPPTQHHSFFRDLFPFFKRSLRFFFFKCQLGHTTRPYLGFYNRK